MQAPKELVQEIKKEEVKQEKPQRKKRGRRKDGPEYAAANIPFQSDLRGEVSQSALERLSAEEDDAYYTDGDDPADGQRVSASIANHVNGEDGLLHKLPENYFM